MNTGYYLQDNPNPTPQYGWPRARVSGVVGVHTAENQTDFEGADPGAEGVAGFLSRRTDYGSYHVLADADSILPLVHPSFAAWADTTNNAHAMSVSGAMECDRWRELSPARAAAIVRNMAYGAARLVQTAVKAGLLSAPTPARRITAAEAIAGTRAGFYGHGETNPGRRHDPGQNFDWALFLSTYAAAIGGSVNTQGNEAVPEQEEDEMLILATAPDSPGKIWVGNGVHRSHVPNPKVLEAKLRLSKNKTGPALFADGKVQFLPEGIDSIGREVAGAAAEPTQSVVGQVKGGSEVWVGDGIERRLVPDVQALEGMRKLSRDGGLDLYRDGETQIVDSLDVLGQVAK